MPLPSKIAYVDVETTGTDREKHGIIQLAIILEKDGKEVAKFNQLMQPFPDDPIDEGALTVNQRTREEIATFPPPFEAYMKTIAFLSQNIAPFDKFDKYHFCGHNADFDFTFLYRWFARNKEYSESQGGRGFYLTNFFCKYKIDTYAMAQLLKSMGRITTEKLKLEVLTQHFQIPHKPHDAESDISATRDLFKVLINLLFEEGKAALTIP